ncbi:MAG: hypothetical protein LBC61_05985 [Candidatus Peribacteria bacterium]|nr:hypothetical protein [Candidatus Peribacteria bacterium]
MVFVALRQQHFQSLQFLIKMLCHHQVVLLHLQEEVEVVEVDEEAEVEDIIMELVKIILFQHFIEMKM